MNYKIVIKQTLRLIGYHQDYHAACRAAELLSTEITTVTFSVYRQDARYNSETNEYDILWQEEANYIAGL